MASLNKVILIGNLGQSAEFRFTTNNIEVASFSVATTSGYKDKEGNWINETTWHNVILWKPSDYVKKGLHKGKSVYVEGRIAKRDYTNKEGVKVYVTEVIAETVKPLNPDKSEGGAGENHSAPESNQGSGGASAPEDDGLPF